MNILVVEDEKNLALALVKILSDASYHADAVYDGINGLSYALSDYYDVVILDVMLPGKDGFEIVREMRCRGVSTPTLLLTAKTMTKDKVTGLDAGADDYLTKPFSPAELLARIRALTRRSGDVIIEELSFYDIRLDLNSHDLESGAKTVHLSSKEFEVMRLLMGSKGRIVSKQELMSRVWGDDLSASENSAEAYISFLRKKLAYLGSQVHIATLRMIGYRLEADAQQKSISPQNRP